MANLNSCDRFHGTLRKDHSAKIVPLENLPPYNSIMQTSLSATVNIHFHYILRFNMSTVPLLKPSLYCNAFIPLLISLPSILLILYITYTVLSIHESCAGYFNQTEVDKILEEGLKMRTFQHHHVMSLIGVCLDAGPAPYIVMPYMANGSLLSYLKRERGCLVLKEDANEEEVQLAVC